MKMSCLDFIPKEIILQSASKKNLTQLERDLIPPPDQPVIEKFSF